MAMRPFRPLGPRQVTEYGLLRLIERARNDGDFLCALTNEIYYDEELRDRLTHLIAYPRPLPIDYPGVLDFMLTVLDEIPSEREQLIQAVNQSETLRTKLNRLIDMLGAVPLGSVGVGVQRAPVGGLRRQKSSSSESSKGHSEGSIRSHPVRLESISSSSGSTYMESPRSGQGSGKSSPRSPR